MMSVSKLSHGDGYAYYSAMTASGDERRRDGQELTGYYVDTGAPVGRWVGKGCAALGVSGGVSEAQMKALFGEGRHPNADQIEADVIASGGSAKDAELASRLGRRPYKYDSATSPIGQRIKDERTSREARLGRELSVDEVRQTRMKVAAEAYEERFGHRHGDDKELATFLSRELSKGSNSVAGYDLTFSPPKSVSVLWGLSDRATSEAISQAHEAAIDDAVAYLEEHAIGTRAGAGGVAQLDVSGLIATRFRHHDSRDGDPQLHDHVVVANKVYDEAGGKWRSLDGAALYRSAVSASEHYNQRLVAHISALGFSFSPRATGPGKRPVMEIDGVDSRLMSQSAKRSAAIRSRTAELVADYVREHGREPDTKLMHQLRQRATLETRSPKAAHRSLDQMREQWSREAAGIVGSDRVAGIVAEAHEAATGARERAIAVRDGLDIIGAGESVITELSTRKSTWAERDIRAEVDRWAARNDGWLLSDFQREAIAQYARDVGSVNLTPRSEAPVLADLTRADGSSIYERRDRNIYTSSRMIDAEYTLLDAAREDAIPAASASTFDETLTHQDVPLDEGQIELARTFACGEKVLAVGIGPAGAGKTTAMRLAVEAIHADGGRVIGLSVAATAAAQLEESTGAESTTLAQWLHWRERANDGEIVPDRFALRPGDVLLVDEAGMAGTLNLHQLVADARTAGAHVRLIGDDRQLQAVESGGALRMIAAEAGAVELTQIHRFRHSDGTRNEEEAAASLDLRNGDLSWYESAGRIHSGRHEDLVAQIVRAWDADDAAGRSSLMMADTNVRVAELNGLAQERRIARGQVDMTHAASLRDGHDAGIGDLIVTRRVDRRLTVDGTRDCVKNGDTWTVRTLHDDGGITAARASDGRPVHLPAQYVKDSTELGYASTVHRAQGRTVDVARSLATTSTSREGLYVAMTRGRHGNDLFVATDDQPRDAILSRITRSDRRDVAARDAMLSEAERVDSPAELGRQHQDVTSRADELRYSAHLRGVLGADAERIITSDARSAVDAALRSVEDAGYDISRLIERHADLLEPEKAEDPGKLLAWRLRNDLARGAEQATSTEHRPLREVPRARLAELAAESAERRAAARESVNIVEARHSLDAKPVIVGERTIPAWTDRAHGNLTPGEISDLVAVGRVVLDEEQHELSDARRELRELQTAWRAHRRAGGSITAPRAQIMAARIEAVETQVETARGKIRASHVDLAELRTEQRLRRSMPTRAWVLEGVQREAQRRHDQTDVEHIAARTSHVLDLEQARRILERESTLDQTIRAEQRRRDVEPDRAVPSPSDGIPRWLAPDRGADDPHMPTAWREHLTARRSFLATRLTADGKALAFRRVPWTRELGPVPPEGTPERSRWESTAGQVNAWRQLHDYTDQTRALPDPADVQGRDRADLEVLRSRLAPRPARGPAERTTRLPSLKAQGEAQRPSEAASTLSDGQQRAEEQMRRRLAQQAQEQQQGKGPIQR